MITVKAAVGDASSMKKLTVDSSSTTFAELVEKLGAKCTFSSISYRDSDGDAVDIDDDEILADALQSALASESNTLVLRLQVDPSTASSNAEEQTIPSDQDRAFLQRSGTRCRSYPGYHGHVPQQHDLFLHPILPGGSRPVMPAHRAAGFSKFSRGGFLAAWIDSGTGIYKTAQQRYRIDDRYSIYNSFQNQEVATTSKADIVEEEESAEALAIEKKVPLNKRKSAKGTKSPRIRAPPPRPPVPPKVEVDSAAPVVNVTSKHAPATKRPKVHAPAPAPEPSPKPTKEEESVVTTSINTAPSTGAKPLAFFTPERTNFGDGKLGVAKRALEAAADDVARWGGNRSTISELKTMKKPPAVVKEVVGACLMLLNSENEPASWDRCIGTMACAGGFITRMTEFRLNKMMSIPLKVLRRLEAITAKFQPREAMKVSKPAAHVCAWVMAVLRFHHVYRKHLPVLEAFAKQGRRVQISMQP
jgi:hypothetical protein